MRFCELLEAQRTYTVTFVYADGTSETVKVKAGEQVASPAVASRSGYTFAGWYTAAQGGTPFRFNSAVDGDMVLYAHWNVYVPVVYDPVCQHTNLTYTDNEDGTHKVVCRDCEEVVDEAAEHMSSDESEGLCTCACGYRYDKWNGTAANEEALTAATDTETKTVKISSAAMLAAFAQSVNAGNTYAGYTVTLETNIDLQNKDWTPIGTAEHPFKGRVFDAQGYIISNLRCNGGVKEPTNLAVANQGLFGYTFTDGNIIEIMNLTIHNVDIYAKNSAGAVIGWLYTDQSAQWLAGYTAIHDVNITGKVTIEAGNAGGIAGAGTGQWALLTNFSNITIDADEGSYLSNVKARELSGEGVGGSLGSVAAIAAWSHYKVDCANIKSNLDVIGLAGNVGGIVGVGNQYWSNVTYTGNITIKNADKDVYEAGNLQCASVIGIIVPTWHNYHMTEARMNSLTVTGTMTIEFSDGSSVTLNSQESDKVHPKLAWGNWAD